MWIQSFSSWPVAQTKLKNFYLSHDSLIACREQTDLCLSWNETQIAPSRIWTRVSDSIIYDDKLYAKRDSIYRSFRGN